MMDSVLAILVIAGSAVILVTIAYKLVPFRDLSQKRPSFVFLPKYKASFDSPPNAVHQALEACGFKAIDGSCTLLERGNIFGDFSARAMKLRAEIDPTQRLLRLHSPWVGILFDTGDLWQIVHDVTTGTQREAD